MARREQVERASGVSLEVGIRDLRSNEVRFKFGLEWTMAEVRNACNCLVPAGYAVREHDLVPTPWWQYALDESEALAGPGDEWRLVDVCWEKLCAGLRRAESGKGTEVRLDFGSLSPLGPARRVGVLFPDARDVSEADMEACRGTPSGRAMLEVLSKSGARPKRVASLATSLWTLEEALRRGDVRLEEVCGVAGFGLDGEVAALVFAGAWCLEDAADALAATEPSPESAAEYRAVQLVGAQPAPGDVVTHRIFDTASVLLDTAHTTKRTLNQPLVEHFAAYTPRFDAKAVRIDRLKPQHALRFPLYSRGAAIGEETLDTLLLDTLANPVLWEATCRALRDDAGATHFLEVGRSDRLQTFLRFIFFKPSSTEQDLASPTAGQDHDEEPAEPPPPLRIMGI